MKRLLVHRAVTLVVALLARGAAAIQIDVTLDPALDVVGQQVIAVQAYTPAVGGGTIVDLAIYDTGASVVSFAAASNAFFPQPHLSPGGAGGVGINGSVLGDVSQPGSILVGGIQDFQLQFDIDTFEITGGIATPANRAVNGIQAFVASESGSPYLPTLAGTPVHGPSAAFPAGSAARITMTGFDIGSSLGLGVPLTFPMLDLVAPGTTLTPRAGSTAPIRIPLSPFGEGNRGAEGLNITAAPNPTFTNVTLDRSATSGSPTTVNAGRLLFDTGAQVSLISGSLATALGLDLSAPETTLAVRGASGTPISLLGFTLDAIELAAAIDDSAVNDVLRFTDVPVFVYDLGIPGLDGILGMNLYNQADEMIVDLINQELSVSFYESMEAGAGGGLADLALLFGNSSAFAGQIVPAFGLGVAMVVPEPATIGGLISSAIVAAVWRLRRRRFVTARWQHRRAGPARFHLLPGRMDRRSPGRSGA